MQSSFLPVYFKLISGCSYCLTVNTTVTGTRRRSRARAVLSTRPRGGCPCQVIAQSKFNSEGT
eukprot:3127709-Rhodomonas_salina.1